MQGENCRFVAAAPAKNSGAYRRKERDPGSGERIEEQRPAATFGFIDSNWPESRVRRARVHVSSPLSRLSRPFSFLFQLALFFSPLFVSLPPSFSLFLAKHDPRWFVCTTRRKSFQVARTNQTRSRWLRPRLCLKILLLQVSRFIDRIYYKQ